MVLAGLVALAGCAHHRTTVTPAASPSATAPATATAVAPPTATVAPLPIPLPASPLPAGPTTHTPTPARPVTPPTPAGTPNAAALVITQADTGKTFTLPAGSVAELRLGGGLGWSTPVATPPILTFTAEPVASGAGYQAWQISPSGHGTATVQSTGAPRCQPGQVCAQYVVLFRATVAIP